MNKENMLPGNINLNTPLNASGALHGLGLLSAVALLVFSVTPNTAFAEDHPISPPSGEMRHDSPPPVEGSKADERAAQFERRGKEMFDKTDTDKDGFISKAEMAASQKERMEEMFNKTDNNKDGKLSPEELKKGREAMREKFKARFKDKNHHGGPEDGKPDGRFSE